MKKNFSSNFPTSQCADFCEYFDPGNMDELDFDFCECFGQRNMHEFKSTINAIEFHLTHKDLVIDQSKNNFIFIRPPIIYDMIEIFNLHPILKNDRTSIYENESARFSVDKEVVRVLLFDENNQSLLEQIRSYFYGQEYAAI